MLEFVLEVVLHLIKDPVNLFPRHVSGRRRGGGAAAAVARDYHPGPGGSAPTSGGWRPGV